MASAATAKTTDVVVVGSCMKDLTCWSPRLPKPGETIKGLKFIEGFGGKGANQCLAGARLGAKTAMVAMVGNDFNGEAYLETFKNHKVNVDHVGLTDAIHTGVATIIVDDNGQNCIVIVNGANEHLTSTEVQLADDLIKGSSILVCQLESNIPGTITALQIAKKHGVQTVMNAAPATKNMPEEIYSLSDVFCVNETEAEELLGKPVSNVEDAGIAARAFLDKGCKIAVVTLGSNGAVFAETGKESYTHILANKVKAVDTTGAGDAFVGSLAYFLASSKKIPLTTIVKRSCDIATISVQFPGTHVSFPWRKDLPAEMFQ